MTSASRNDSEPSVYGRIFVRCNIKQNVLTPRGSNPVGPGEVDKRSDYTSCPSWTNLTVCPFFFFYFHIVRLGQEARFRAPSRRSCRRPSRFIEMCGLLMFSLKTCWQLNSAWDTLVSYDTISQDWSGQFLGEIIKNTTTHIFDGLLGWWHWSWSCLFAECKEVKTS